MDNLGIAFKLSDQVITFWQFYVVWMAGVVGWVFSRESAWSSQKRTAIGIAIVIFNIFNITGLFKTSSSLATIVKSMDVKPYKLPEGVSEPVFGAAIERLSVGDWYWTIVAHILADLIVLYFVFVVAKKQPSA